MPARITTLEELKKVTKAYDGFVTIADCDIPDYYKNIFPHKCECGAEMIITEPEHTQLQCCNPSCYLKMGYRLAYFISKMGYKGFGEQSSLTLVREGLPKFKYPTFLSSFLMNDTELHQCLTEHLADLFADIRDDLKQRPVYFSEAIAALGIQGIGSRSALFSVVKNPVVLVQAILKDNIGMVCDAAGIMAPMTRYQLFNSKLDILTLMKDVVPHILSNPSEEIYIAITGRVSVNGVGYTRQEFLDLCQAIPRSSRSSSFKLVETKSASKLQYVIADSPSNSDKYLLGESLGILITAEDFYAKLKERAGGDTEVQEEESKEKEVITNG